MLPWQLLLRASTTLLATVFCIIANNVTLVFSSCCADVIIIAGLLFDHTVDVYSINCMLVKNNNNKKKNIFSG